MTRAARDGVIVACAASAGIHAAVAPEHFAERTAAGVGFLASAVLLAVLAVAMTRRPSSLLAVALAGATLAGLLAAYALAITSGVPVLHPEPEPVDGLALTTKAIEALGLFLALDVLRRERVLALPDPKGT
jgi:hypothetical protein